MIIGMILIWLEERKHRSAIRMRVVVRELRRDPARTAQRAIPTGNSFPLAGEV
jgi:hypothetical protein